MTNDLKIFQKNDKLWNLSFKDSNGNSIIASSDTLLFTVRQNKVGCAINDNDALITADILITSASSGTATLTLLNSQTNLKPDMYFYDITKIDSASKINTFFTGDFEIKSRTTTRTI